MQMTVLTRRKGTIALAALAIAGATLLLLALNAISTTTAANAQPRHATRHHAKHHAKHHAPAASETSGESSGETSGESSVESEQGQPGEPANGHADAPGSNANHDCTGNCVE